MKKYFLLIATLGVLGSCQREVVPYLYQEYTEPALTFYNDAGKLKKDFEREFEKIKDQWLAVDEMAHEDRTLENTIKRYDELSSRLYFPGMTFLAYVSDKKAIRETAQACEKQLDAWLATLSLRKGTYQAIKAVQDRYKDELKGETKRIIEEDIKNFERSGILLSEEKRKALEKINQRLASLSQDYSINIREDKSKVFFSREELKGVPETSLKQWKKNKDGLYEVGMDYPSYFAVIDNAERSQTRKKLLSVYYKRAYPKNIEILKKVLALKKEKAEILGYPSIRHYLLEDLMARSPDRVDEFLSDLAETIREAAEANKKKLTEENAGNVVQLWDIFYLKNQIKKRDYQVDEEEIRKYFSLKQVLRGCQNLYADLFSIKFEEVPAHAWHKDVKKLLVKSEGKVIAGIYLDLFPRENKYSHAAQFSLRKGRYLGNGRYESPVVALVCNFTKPDGERPSLLTANEVATYFHEFGHAMHSCLEHGRIFRFFWDGGQTRLCRSAIANV